MANRKSAKTLTRRRFIVISGASAAFSGMFAAGAGPELDRQIWRGTALGADTSIELHGLAPEKAEALIEACITELARLESLFSLYDPASQISQLNETGYLDSPDPDFLKILSMSQYISGLTAGAFDITVQPLWELYASHYKAARADNIADPAGPSRAALAKVGAVMGMDKLQIKPKRVTLASGKITLNGIAQGYISDKLTALLKAGGVEHALVNAGEYAAIGARRDETGWPISILDPHNDGAVLERVELVDHALSTSGSYGAQFSDDGRAHHMFDPRTGQSSNLYLSVTVTHPEAAMADGLSTALYAMKESDIGMLKREHPEFRAILLKPDGRLVRI